MIDLKKCETCYFRYHAKYPEWFCDNFNRCEENNKYKPYTNGDVIRQMDDDELADWLCNFGFCVREKGDPCIAGKYCYTGHNGFKQWVKESVKIDW